MDLIDRASALKAIDEYERLSAVSQTVHNMTSLREIVQWLPSVQTCDDAVSRQAAIDAIGALSDAMFENIKKGATFPKRQWFDGMANAESIIKDLPSAQPEPEITRCKDCKHWGKGGLCEIWDYYISNEDFYCGCAKRRAE